MPGTLIRKKPQQKNRSSGPSDHGYAARTILFNDDFHSFDEVAQQLVRAIHCTFARAMGFATEVHLKGLAVVYSGHIERCEAVAEVLSQIRLRVKVER